MKPSISYVLYDPEANKFMTNGARGNSTSSILSAWLFRNIDTAERQRENHRRYTQVLQVTMTTALANEKPRSERRAA